MGLFSGLFSTSQVNAIDSMNNNVLKILIRSFAWSRFMYRVIGFLAGAVHLIQLILISSVVFQVAPSWVLYVALVLQGIISGVHFSDIQTQYKNRVNQLFKVLTKLAANPNDKAVWEATSNEIIQEGLLLGVDSSGSFDLVGQLGQGTSGSSSPPPSPVGSGVGPGIGAGSSTVGNASLLQPLNNTASALAGNLATINGLVSLGNGTNTTPPSGPNVNTNTVLPLYNTNNTLTPIPSQPPAPSPSLGPTSSQAQPQPQPLLQIPVSTH